MTKFTNKLGLPETIMQWAIETFQPPSDPKIMRASEIGDSLTIALLSRRHADEITRDISDLVYALLGTAVHEMLSRMEGSTNALIEEALEREVPDMPGWRITGHCDYLQTSDTAHGRYDLSDYKVSSVWAFILGDKPEWECQVNVYAWLYEGYGFRIARRQIVGILRDWKERDARQKPDYPQQPVVVVPQKEWTPKVAGEWVARRVREFAELLKLSDDALPACTPAERWNKSAKWAVKKSKKAKRAVTGGLYDDPESAREHAEAIGGVVEHRPGEDTRCTRYCDVAEWCPFFKKVYGGK